MHNPSDRNRGNPHPTDKTGDPYHASITLGINDVQGKDRVTSAHVYPDGSVTFSKECTGESKLMLILLPPKKAALPNKQQRLQLSSISTFSRAGEERQCMWTREITLSL
jgi:hypothetical protein